MQGEKTQQIDKAVEDDTKEQDSKEQDAQDLKPPIKSKIGGQALIEGIMMRGLDISSMAVRCADGRIDLETWESGSLTNPKWYRKTPFVRGIINMGESLMIGYKCLMKSADKAIDGLEDENDISKKKNKESKPEADKAIDPSESAGEVSEEQPGNIIQADINQQEEVSAAPILDAGQADASPQEAVIDEPNSAVNQVAPNRQENAKENSEDKKSSSGTGWLNAIGMVLGVGIALLLFMFVPMWITNGISGIVPLGFWKTVIEGVLKIAILVAYMWAMSLVKDTRRTFEYHGAEHKSIACYESGEPLTVENVKKCIRFHPRCGTNFILIVLLISILVTSIVTWNTLWLRLIIKIALLPVIVGISYEIIRLVGRSNNLASRIVSAPGMALQKITTKEPDDSQIEVAIAALNAVIPENRDIDKW